MLCLALLFSLAIVPIKATMPGASTPGTTNSSGKLVTPSDQTVKPDDMKGSDMKMNDKDVGKDSGSGILNNGDSAGGAVQTPAKQLPDNVVH